MISSSSVVRGAVRRGPPDALDEAALHDPDRDVRVPDVDGEEHAAIIRGGPCAPDEACGPSASVRADAIRLTRTATPRPGPPA